MIDHSGHHRMGYHEKDYHQTRKCRLKYINHSESCLLYQNHELFQDFDHCLAECAKKAMVLQDNMESNDFDVSEEFFLRVSKIPVRLP